MRFKKPNHFLILILLFFSGNLFAQKYLFHADSCTAEGFPLVKGQVYHRGYGETILKKEQLEIREDGTPVAFSLTTIPVKTGIPHNKRVLFLIENHYQPKGVPQRNFFANVISAGIYNAITPGDKVMIATFDWQRKGQYIFRAFENFTDDSSVLRTALRGLAAPPVLYNRQEGADINSALDESLKFLSPVSDSLPTAIILFSDDLDNSVGKIVNLDIKNKSLQANIPIYAVSYYMYSRYNPVMQNEICTPTYGRYFISPTNDISTAGQKLNEFLNEIITDYQGSHFSFSYNSKQQKSGQKLNLTFNVINTSLTDAETVSTPALTFGEKLARNKLTAILIAAGALAVILFLILYLRKTRNRQEDLIKKTRDELNNQTEAREKEKASTEAQIRAIHQQQADKETERMAEEKRNREEERLIQLMLARGVFPSLHYSYKESSGKVDINKPLFTIGRDKTNHFFIQLDTVSRKHATIVFDDSGTYTIIDADSSNGTFVNGERIRQAVLRSDDLIQIGGINLIFHN